MDDPPRGPALQVKLLTLRYSPEQAGFDEQPLSRLVADKQVLAVREHFFVFQDLPHLACLVTYVDRPSTPAEAEPSPSTTRRPARPTRDLFRELPPHDRPLADQLRQWRARRAREDGVPPYVILTNRELLAVLAAKPTSLTALRRIQGIGTAKAERYGIDILQLLTRTEPRAEVTP